MKKEDITRKFNSFMGIIMMVMVVGAVWQVVSRYVFNMPSTITEDLLRYLLVWACMIGSMFAFYSGDHLALTLLADRLNPKQTRIYNIVIDLAILLLFIVFFIPGGLKLVSSAMKQLSPTLQVPMGYVFIIIPLTAILIAVIKIGAIVKNILALKVSNLKETK